MSPIVFCFHEFVSRILLLLFSASSFREYTVCDWLKYDPYRRNEIWRFLTYMFVHTDFGHIFGNLILQIFLGLALELVHHWWRVSLVYLAGVLAGSLGHSLSNTNSLAGASAGVYALITAHIATVIMVRAKLFRNQRCETDFSFLFMLNRIGRKWIIQDSSSF